MARQRKQSEQKIQEIECGESLEQVVFKNFGEYRTNLVKSKLNGNDLEKLIHRLLVEWAQGRVNL